MSSGPAPPGCAMRREPTPDDVAAVAELVDGTGFFSTDEVRIAGELVAERLARGPRSGYRFLFLDRGARLVGYTCYGRVDGTRDSWDLYWIAVGAGARGRGLGRLLLRATEAEIAAAGGGRVWVETSSRELYTPTRGFYEACGYERVAELGDFYAPGDAKLVYVRRVPGTAAAR